jgi:hypothetical protein
MLPDNHDSVLMTLMMKTNEAILTRRWNYYIGKHPKIWATAKLQETFKDLADSFVENYCSTAINSRVQRLQITGWDGNQEAERIWLDAGLKQRQDVMYRWALTHGTAYLMVQDGRIAVNPATLAYAQPDPDDWLKVAWAGKSWMNIDDGKWYAILWDETHMYKYATRSEIAYFPGESLNTFSNYGFDFVLTEVIEHGYSEVPVVPMTPFGFMASPVIDQISPIQDKINKLSANKFVVSEFTAFKQRVFFTRQQLDPYAVRQQPDHAIVLDPGDSDAKASVTELGGMDMTGYDEAKEREIDALFTIATLPRHLRAKVGSQVSGEAMKADEAPFIESILDHQREFGEALTTAMRIVGVESEPIWRDPAPRDEHINAQTVQALVGAGMPWQIAVSKYMGLTPEEIAEAEAISQQEKTAQQTLMQTQTAGLLMNPFIANNEENALAPTEEAAKK